MALLVDQRALWLGLGWAWRDFYALTPFATAKALSARIARRQDEITTAAYMTMAFDRTKKPKSLSTYLAPKVRRKDGGEQGRLLAALGVTETEIDEARKAAGLTG